MSDQTTPAAVSVEQPNRVLVTFAVDLAESMTSPRWVLCPQRQHSSFLIDSVDPVGCPWCSSGDELDRLRARVAELEAALDHTAIETILRAHQRVHRGDDAFRHCECGHRYDGHDRDTVLREHQRHVAELLRGRRAEHPAPRPAPRTGSFAADGPGPRHFTDEEA